MEVLYLNTNGFSGRKDKNSEQDANIDIAKNILREILHKDTPDVLYFSEFDANSKAGQEVIKELKEKGYTAVYPNAWNYVSESYTSIVMAFVREEIKSQTSPQRWLKWNEILVNDYRLVGVHIPDSSHKKADADSFWTCISEHYQKYKREKLLYIGDMNVFMEGTPGKEKLDEILETAKDGWILTGHTNSSNKDFTTCYSTRIDYAILSEQLALKIKEMENRQEFYKNKLSDHSAIMVQF